LKYYDSQNESLHKVYVSVYKKFLYHGVEWQNAANVPKGKDLLTLRLRERLIALRDQARISDAGIARAAHLRQQDVSRFMLGDMKFPPLDFLDALARVFEHTLPELLAKDVPTSSLTASQRSILATMKTMKPAERVAFESLILKKAGSGRRRG
jgi:transcriptional regulator with XRE-family HTH domain